MARDPMRKYLVSDPLPVRLKDFYWRRVHCPLFGHKPRLKMHCTICDRCRIVLTYR